MANAKYHKGNTIDPDEEGAFLKIEGKKYHYLKQDGVYTYKSAGSKQDDSKAIRSNLDLIKLGEMIIDDHPKTEILKKTRERHIEILEGGVKKWNDWREKEPHIRPILYNLGNDKESAGIKLKKLKNINFSNANLIEADLSGVNLTNANFHEANLGGAKLIEANLTKANFCRADLYKTDLSGANLTKANLQGAQIAGVKFNNAGNKKTKLIKCKVYGSSAWDIELDQTMQEDLEIVYKKEGDNTEYTKLYVNDLSMAQFLYFILNNKNLSSVFNTTNSSLVLLLGRFANKEKKVLDKLRMKIRDTTEKKYIPILFDFKKPDQSDYTGVISVLAGLSRFIIADLTNPKSIPQELQAIVGGFQTPLIPLIKSSKKNETAPFSMFVDFYKYAWVHPVIEYATPKILFKHFDKLIYAAENFYQKINKTKTYREAKRIPIAKLGCKE